MVKLLLKLPTVLQLQWIFIPPPCYLFLTCLKLTFHDQFKLLLKGTISHPSPLHVLLLPSLLLAWVLVQLQFLSWQCNNTWNSMGCGVTSALLRAVPFISSTGITTFVAQSPPMEGYDLMDVPAAHGWLFWAPLVAQGEKQSPTSGKIHHSPLCTLPSWVPHLCEPSHIILF